MNPLTSWLFIIQFDIIKFGTKSVPPAEMVHSYFINLRCTITVWMAKYNSRTKNMTKPNAWQNQKYKNKTKNPTTKPKTWQEKHSKNKNTKLKTKNMTTELKTQKTQKHDTKSKTQQQKHDKKYDTKNTTKRKTTIKTKNMTPNQNATKIA